MAESVILKMCRERGIIPTAYCSAPKAPGNDSKAIPKASSQIQPTVSKKDGGHDSSAKSAAKPSVESEAKPIAQEPSVEKPTKKMCVPKENVAESAPEPSVQEPVIEEPTKKVCGPKEKVPESAPVQEPAIEEPTKKVCGTKEKVPESAPEPSEPAIEEPTKKVCGPKEKVPESAPVQEPAIEEPTKKVCGTKEKVAEPAPEPSEVPPVVCPVKKVCVPCHKDGSGSASGSNDGDTSNAADGDGLGGTDGTEGDGSDDGNGGDDSASGDGDQEFVLSTAPFDPRFPNTNQTKHCATAFIDFHRCTRLRGEGYEPCNYFKKVFNSICPNKWIEKWNEQIEAGTYPVNLDP